MPTVGMLLEIGDVYGVNASDIVREVRRRSSPILRRSSDGELYARARTLRKFLSPHVETGNGSAD